MFEREIKDAAFIKRWTITRNLRDQNVAEHSWCVAMYANDICVYFGLDGRPALHRDVLQYALWHDSIDEIFSGDTPGPNKREMITDKAGFKSTLLGWASEVFGPLLDRRSGSLHLAASDYPAPLIKQIVKVADWLEAATEDGTEVQMGNLCREVHFLHDGEQCLTEAGKLCDMLGVGEDDKRAGFFTLLLDAIRNSVEGQSRGPVISKEMRPAAARRRGRRSSFPF